MAAYTITRQRTLRGMGTTFSFVPRRKGLRGLGQDSTDIDMVTGLPCDDPRANCGPIAPDISPSFPLSTLPFPTSPPPLPPGAFTPAKPIIPAPVITPVTPPTIAPSPIQLVFPSQGTVAPPPKYAAPLPTASWFDQQMISGIPNSYLALGTFGLVLFVSMSGAKRRR
jgi:hypothetical protein